MASRRSAFSWPFLRRYRRPVRREWPGSFSGLSKSAASCSFNSISVIHLPAGHSACDWIEPIPGTALLGMVFFLRLFTAFVQRHRLCHRKPSFLTILLQIHKISCHFCTILLFYTSRMEAIVMLLNQFPVIDLPATGANIRRLRQTKGLSVRDLQQFFGFEEPQAIYKWQRGQSLPTVDNLYALSTLLDVPMNDILVAADLPELHICTMSGRPEPAAHLFCPRARGAWRNFKAA